MGKPIPELNPKPLRDQFAVGQIKIRLAGRFVQVHCLKRLGADRDPKSVCRANLRQNELGWKVAIASGCIGATRSRGNAGDRECEKTSNPPTTQRISSAILVIARSHFQTHPPSFLDERSPNSAAFYFIENSLRRYCFVFAQYFSDQHESVVQVSFGVVLEAGQVRAATPLYGIRRNAQRTGMSHHSTTRRRPWLGLGLNRLATFSETAERIKVHLRP